MPGPLEEPSALLELEPVSPLLSVEAVADADADVVLLLPVSGPALVSAGPVLSSVPAVSVLLLLPSALASATLVMVAVLAVAPLLVLPEDPSVADAEPVADAVLSVPPQPITRADRARPSVSRFIAEQSRRERSRCQAVPPGGGCGPHGPALVDVVFEMSGEGCDIDVNGTGNAMATTWTECP